MRLQVIRSERHRRDIMEQIRREPLGTRVIIRGPQRSLEQNDKLWAILTDVSKQLTHYGEYLDPEEWKIVFVCALRREMKWTRALDGRGAIPLSTSTSAMSKSEMIDLIELITAYGAEHGVTWSDEENGGDEEAGIPAVRAERNSR
jgi:hypothetical protein